MPDSPQSTPADDTPDAGDDAPESIAENVDGLDDAGKARDLLRADRLARRERLGERLLQRVGGRMWDRPTLACSARLYKRFQIDDPWAPPGSDQRRKKLGLGPVNLRFGERKRQPAPHLKIKDPNKKKKAQAVDPVAKYRRPQPKPKPQSAQPQSSQSSTPAPRPAPAKAPNPAASNAPKSMQPGGKYALPTGSSGEFGGGKQKRGLVGKLPQRPDLVAGKAPPRRASPPQKRPAAKPQRAPAPTRAPTPARTPAPKSSSRPQARTRKPPVGGGGGGGGVPLPRPKLPTPKKRRAGRFRMSPTEVRSPVVRNIEKPEPVVAVADGPVDRAPPAPEKKKKKVIDKPIDRSIPTGPMGLDDLFGSMAGGRMRFGRKRKKKDASEEDS